MTSVVNKSGKRKRAIARAVLKPGKGQIKINSKPISLYQPALARERLMEPLMIAGDDVIKKIRIDIDVHGGGIMSQAEAARLAIARALVAFTGSKKLEKDYLTYDRQMLIADVRRKEMRKPNDSKARKKRQKSYR